MNTETELWKSYALIETGSKEEKAREAIEAVSPSYAVIETFLDMTGIDLPEDFLDPYKTSRIEDEEKFTQIDLSDLKSANIPPPEFQIEHIIPRKVVTLLGAHGGTGKSNLALTWASHIACGRHWAGLEVKKGKSLFVSLEDAGEVVRYRLKKIAEAYALDYYELTQNLTILDGTKLEKTALMDKGYGALDKTLTWGLFNEACKGKDFIALDNTSDAFAGNEISRSEVRQFMNGLARIAQRENAGFLLLAHVDKSTARGLSNQSYSGSTAWHNSARSRLSLKDDGGLMLTHDKSNFGKAMEKPMYLRFDDGVIVPNSFAQQDPGKEEEALLQAMRKAISEGATLSPSREGRGNFYKTLESHGWTGIKDLTYRALSALQEQGRVIIEDYQKDYKARQRLKIVEDSANPPIYAESPPI